jgi:streptogrisin D
VRIQRSVRHRAALIVTAGLVAGTALAAPTAHAATSASAQDTAVTATTRLATTLSDRLGTSTAGSYLTSAGTLVVTVTTAAAAQQVRAAGASARLVKHSGASLTAATKELSRSAAIAGTSWAVDPITNQVVVTADSTVTGAKLTRLKATVGKLGGTARLESTPGTLRMLIAGGDPIYTGGARCSLGFNVASANGTAYALTAGHCTNIGTRWTGPGNRYLGDRAGSSFPGNDFGIIRYADGWDRPGGVNMYDGSVRDITSAADPVVGQQVERTGSTTGRRGGVVTGLNTTVNYPQGSVTGMIRTTVCAEGGDSGGALFAGNTALGLTSGGSGNCSSGGTTYFQPVVEALYNYGVWVY